MTSPSPEASDLPATITVCAPAKINLVLRILDRRPDGYHNLWSLMQTVRLEDELSMSINHTHSAITLRCDDPSLKTDHSNLVYRAAVAVLERSRQTVGVDIALTKQIPMGAGLGGGSSDAAATIIGLNRILNLGWSPEEMAQVGQTLGSDVSFFFFAPSATVAGRGETVMPVRMTGSRWIVLVNPSFPVETKWAYQQLSESRTGVVPVSPSHAALETESELSWKQVLEAAENDFETPVFSAYPLLRHIKQQLTVNGAEVALLSGSGATVFGVFRDETSARHAQASFLNEQPFKVFVAETCSYL
ncbi:MAG: 4-(cytidine 5'-diphospho)-2-C-methyl-D-erythritol kinase [Nitrospira sp.]|nr:4-(cytidine 5'-diphospho)-2-C-methyl-D-erythritol kinase [Nitrospira sp.]MDH4368994.1 4-(cytidine 5'-diphospho)-2-C-methyl-D-erythritol kinase [Nitrospira sp.]MDH5347285.1 4-(cytidine 5'-diphospho)-2-C-methyl-D-erythritol kinase [Nitrospira sp.]MDH5496640.1 4-(cytidine 5'-diphospho)-2-C-methyl-D-erythritol kinase [Nitrospira sp.]MDH5727120.1 4-(cytidine 5'-diphospho)-2-C-methyl-D-erythritol kinase [Nitrospira sp.]